MRNNPPSKRSMLIALIIIIILITGLIIFENVHPHKKIKQLPVSSVEQPTTLDTIPVYKIVGTSVQGRNIESYTFGTGEKHLLFAGGMHGGYEWNSVLLAYQVIDYLKANPTEIPANISVTIIPVLNPDGLYEVTNKEGWFTPEDVSDNQKILANGRFNAHNVDLNRNFACNWKATSTWQNKIESAGTSAFSEPEAASLKNYILDNKPAVAVFWHSQSGTVYASECNNGILPQTLDVMKAYAHAAGYKTDTTFNVYAITGDSEGWLASIGIPAITVELKTHETVELDQNLAGIRALLEYYSKK